MTTATKPQRETTNGDGGELLDDLLAKQSQSRELAMLRMENETIMAECRMHPRDMVKIKGQLEELLNNFPEFADDAIYAKDVGGGKIAEDLSIRAAEALAEAYGYNRIRASVSLIDDDHAKIEATFTDFQTGRIWQDDCIVSKWYTASKARGGGRVRHDDDRFHNTVAKAAKSKVIREVICRSVNPALKAWFKNECEKVLSKTLKPEDADKIIAAWKAIGVGLEKLEQLVGKPLAMGWLASDQVRLRTLYVGVRDNETTIESLLGIDQSPPKKTAADITAEIDGKKTKKGKPGELPMSDADRFDLENPDAE